MIVQPLVLGPVATNCYIVVCEETKKAIVVDPGDEANKILNVVQRLGAEVLYVVDTHGHFDHTLANQEIKEATGAKFGIHPLDVPLLKNSVEEMGKWLLPVSPRLVIAQPDLLLNDGDELRVGNIVFKVLHTPGHSPGHITLVAEGKAFVGDVLFFQGIGRTDLQGGSLEVLMDSIRRKLLTLDDDVLVYPGHGPKTTIGQERRSNPWLNM